MWTEGIGTRKDGWAMAGQGYEIRGFDVAYKKANELEEIIGRLKQQIDEIETTKEEELNNSNWSGSTKQKSFIDDLSAYMVAVTELYNNAVELHEKIDGMIAAYKKPEA